MGSIVRSMYIRLLYYGYTYTVAKDGAVQCYRGKKYNGQSDFNYFWIGKYFIRREDG